MTMKPSTKRVHLAIARTPREYLTKTLGQRIHHSLDQVGSYFPSRVATHVKELLAELLMTDWELYDHPAVGPGATAFRCNLPGRVGVVHLNDLDASLDPVISIINPKKLPHGQAIVYQGAGRTAYPAPLVEFSVAILGSGAELGEEDEILWTVHPGDPVKPTEVSLDHYRRQLTIAEARALNIEWVKVLA